MLLWLGVFKLAQFTARQECCFLALLLLCLCALYLITLRPYLQSQTHFQARYRRS